MAKNNSLVFDDENYELNSIDTFDINGNIDLSIKAKVNTKTLDNKAINSLVELLLVIIEKKNKLK